MTGSQVQRYFKIEELYREVTLLVSDDTLDDVGETYVRRLLDAVLSAGKIEGRLTAYNDGSKFHRSSLDNDLLIEGWQRIVGTER